MFGHREVNMVPCYNVQSLRQNLQFLLSRHWLSVILKWYQNYTILLMLWQRSYYQIFLGFHTYLYVTDFLHLFSLRQGLDRRNHYSNLLRLLRILLLVPLLYRLLWLSRRKKIWVPRATKRFPFLPFSFNTPFNLIFMTSHSNCLCHVCIIRFEW